jgi:predicted house-cleaning noncanonical NTP pyrophosphatase (MazG superfamily)
MTESVIFSDYIERIEWSELESFRLTFGPKGAGLLTLPRKWTLPFALISPAALGPSSEVALSKLDDKTLERIRLMGEATKLYVRSSIIGETIWDRGSYLSVTVEASQTDFRSRLSKAAQEVIASAPRKEVALVIQAFVEPRARGELGNLMRVSKTKDHWELSSEAAGAIQKVRFNAQRDEAADANAPLAVRSGVQRERLFGSIASWVNNELLRGRGYRVTCEWVADHSRVYLVQIDQEGEDILGINPFQIRVPPAHQPAAASGNYLLAADQAAIRSWDKLLVLTQLWDETAVHRPTLLYVALANLPKTGDAAGTKKLEDDFGTLIGPNNIVVRTSVRAGGEKFVNLRRTEGLTPIAAAKWCLDTRDQFRAQGKEVGDLAFVAHRFIAAHAAAWVRAEPGNPIVEIHSLWGLPDALQYCAYDIWEVHVPTETATEYPDYKSDMLIAGEEGGWKYVRIANAFGRSLSIGRREALDLATRTAAIADRLQEPCHVMWFVGCVAPGGEKFNIPWYWTKAHAAEKNSDRTNYQVIPIASHADLEAFKRRSGPMTKFALDVIPNNQDLMRDMNFIGDIGVAAKAVGIPVILSGSTLAHAYFELSRQGCVVVARGEKEHSRVRRNTVLGKIVRDKIPERIAQRQEAEITRQIPSSLKKGFLTSKLLEEALEVRNAQTPEEKRAELGDLLEVVRALIKTEGFTLDEVIVEADLKKKKAGGFDQGLVLMQTGILGRDRQAMLDTDRPPTQVLARRTGPDTYELPFTFFGFMDLDQPRSLVFEDFGVRIDIALRNDKIELQISKNAEQLELPLDMELPAEDETD